MVNDNSSKQLIMINPCWRKLPYRENTGSNSDLNAKMSIFEEKTRFSSKFPEKVEFSVPGAYREVNSRLAGDYHVHFYLSAYRQADMFDNTRGGPKIMDHFPPMK